MNIKPIILFSLITCIGHTEPFNYTQQEVKSLHETLKLVYGEEELNQLIDPETTAAIEWYIQSEDGASELSTEAKKATPTAFAAGLVAGGVAAIADRALGPKGPVRQGPLLLTSFDLEENLTHDLSNDKNSLIHAFESGQLGVQSPNGHQDEIYGAVAARAVGAAIGYRAAKEAMNHMGAISPESVELSKTYFDLN